MANNILTPSMITRYSIRMFLNTNYFVQNISRQFESQFGIEGARIGAQLRVRIPNRYTPTDGPGLSVQDTTEQQFLLTVATRYRHCVGPAMTLAVMGYHFQVMTRKLLQAVDKAEVALVGDIADSQG